MKAAIDALKSLNYKTVSFLVVSRYHIGKKVRKSLLIFGGKQESQSNTCFSRVLLWALFLLAGIK